MRTYPLQLEWAPLPIELNRAQHRLGYVLRAWQGTPYLSGQRLLGVGADCIGAVFGVIDQIDGRPRAQSPKLPHDTALHAPGSAYKAVAAIKRLYAPAKRLRTRYAQPGDLLIVGSTLGGPGHLMMVGAQRNTVWHASNSAAGFSMTGWALGDGFERLFAIYRLMDRERWAA